MASNYICRACLRTLRSQRSSLRTLDAPLTTPSPRTFTPSLRFLQACTQSSSSSAPKEAVFKTPQTPTTARVKNHEPAKTAKVEPKQPIPSEQQQPQEPSPKIEDLGPVPTAAQLNALLRNRKPGLTETYTAYGITESLLSECASQASYAIPLSSPKDPLPKTADGQDLGVGHGWWYDTPSLGLAPTFSTWAQITFLHMYILLVRLRLLPDGATGIWIQHLTDHFFNTAEEKMITVHRIDNSSMRKRYLKDLFEQWRGVIAAYDEGLVKGDAVLAAAVWRNVFKGVEDVDPVGLAMVVGFLRREVARVGGLPEHVLERGKVGFGSPAEERSVVLMESRLMKEPFGEGGGS